MQDVLGGNGLATDAALGEGHVLGNRRIEVMADHQHVEVLTSPADFEAVKNALEAAGLKPELAEVTMRPENTIELTGDDAARMQKLIDVIEDLDDVQEVFHNAEIAE